jgi:hypothetical protein
VRNLVRAGVTEHTAMKITGHKTRSIFDRYDIVSENDVRKALDRFSAFHRDNGCELRGTVKPFGGRRARL